MAGRLAFFLLPAIALAQDVIEADEASPGTQVSPGQHVYTTAPMSQERYSSGMHASGAGETTLWVMMGTVFLGYMALMCIMMLSCLWGPRVQAAPFQRFPDMEASQQDMYKNTAVADLDAMWRKAFVGKVYGLLCLQILLTLVIVVAMMQGGYGFYAWALTDGAWTRGVALISTFVLIISMMCFKNAYPMNLILLFSFTACTAYTIGITCSGFAANGMLNLVVEAFAITSLIFIALTIFTMQSKIDFSFLGMVLPICLFSFMIWGFFAVFAFPSFAFSQVYALIGVILFSLYVLYDTHAITTYLCYDDYVLGAINLYLDFVNLFLFILQLLTSCRTE